jgi:hypothetical protein
MLTPRLGGYPVDRAVLERAQRERAARRARRKAAPPRRRWLAWMAG